MQEISRGARRFFCERGERGCATECGPRPDPGCERWGDPGTEAGSPRSPASRDSRVTGLGDRPRHRPTLMVIRPTMLVSFEASGAMSRVDFCAWTTNPRVEAPCAWRCAGARRGHAAHACWARMSRRGVGSKWPHPLVENLKIAVVAEDAVPALARQLAHDAKVQKQLHA
jgi:hypothetical protein